MTSIGTILCTGLKLVNLVELGLRAIWREKRLERFRPSNHLVAWVVVRARARPSFLATCVRVYSNVINLNSKLAVNIYEPTSHKR